MLDMSRGESDLFHQDVSAKGKPEGEQRTANNKNIKFGGGKDFLYDSNLDGITVVDYERNYFAIGELFSFSEDACVDS